MRRRLCMILVISVSAMAGCALSQEEAGTFVTKAPYESPWATPAKDTALPAVSTDTLPLTVAAARVVPTVVPTTSTVSAAPPAPSPETPLSSPSTPPPPPTVPPPWPPATPKTPVPAAPATPAPSLRHATVSPGVNRTYNLGEGELAVWRDPEFRRQFALSYLADTEIEPVGALTDMERRQMLAVLPLIEAGRMDEAAHQLELHRQPKNANAVFDFTLANIYFQQDKLDEAAQAYEVAVGKFPKFRRAWRNLALTLMRQSRFEKALPVLTKAIELGAGDALMYGLLGYAHSSVAKPDNVAAESAYRMAILMDPRTLDWKMGLARSFFQQRRYADAVALCQQLIADNPDQDKLWLHQANAYIGLNQPIKAAENLEFVDALGKSTAGSLNMLGDVYVNEGLFSLAVRCYVRAMEMDPKAKPDRVIRAAKVLTARRALQETKELLKHIEGLGEGRISAEQRKDVLKLRARIAVAEGAGEEQAHVLEEIVQLDPLDGDALILLGQYYGRNDEPEKAVFYFERAAAINEEYEADAKVRHAQILVKQGKYADALPLLRRAQQIRPNDNVQRYLEEVERAAGKGR